MSDEPFIKKLELQVLRHTTSEEAEKATVYGIVMKNKKGDAIKATLKLETVDPNLTDEFGLQERIQLILTNPQTRLPTSEKEPEDSEKPIEIAM